jgi:hypothetical protein
MDGPTLIRHIHRVNPAARIIGSSGHQVDGSDPQFAGLHMANLLTKPFTAGELLGKIRSTLDAHPSSGNGASPES